MRRDSDLIKSERRVEHARQALHQKRVEIDRAYAALIEARTEHYALLDRIASGACATSNSGASSSAH